jgi:predicted secreted protein
MTAFVGRAVLIEMGVTSLASVLRTKTINFNGELVDITTDGDNGWATTLDGVFNLNNVSIALDGVLKDDVLTDMAFSGAQEAFTVVIDDLFSLDGTWQFQPGFSIGAPYNAEATFSGTLQSVGAVTKGAVTP